MTPSIQQNLAVALLLLSSPTLVKAQCTICSDGTTPTGQFGGIPCGDFQADLATVGPTSELCLQVQLEAFQACHCPEYPADEYCPLCADGFFNLERPQRPVVIWKQPDDNNNFVTCQDVLFGDRSVEGECERNAAAAYYCGCPEADAPATPTCSLCPASSSSSENSDSTTSDNQVVSSQQATTTGRVPPLFTATCDDYKAAVAAFFTTDTCADAVTSLQAGVPVDVPAYCGCNSNGQAPSCELCPADTTLDDSKMAPVLQTGNRTSVSCGEWAAVAQHVIDTEYCTTDLEPARQACCMPQGPVVPAPAPPSDEEDSTVDRGDGDEGDGDDGDDDDDSSSSSANHHHLLLLASCMLSSWFWLA